MNSMKDFCVLHYESAVNLNVFVVCSISNKQRTVALVLKSAKSKNIILGYIAFCPISNKFCWNFTSEFKNLSSSYSYNA